MEREPYAYAPATSSSSRLRFAHSSCDVSQPKLAIATPSAAGWAGSEQQRQGLADLFAQANAEGEAERADEEVAVGVEGGSVGKADELHDPEQERDDVRPAEHDALRVEGDPLDAKQQEDPQ